MSFFRNTALFMGSRTIYSLLVLLIGVLTARWLGVEDRGHYAMIFALMGVISNSANFGIGQSNTYFINREKISFDTIFSNNVVFVLCIGIILAAAFFIGRFLFAIGPDPSYAWGLMWLGCVSLIVDVTFSGIILGRQLYWLQSAATIINAVLLLLATLAILLFDGALVWAVGLRVLALAVFAIGLVVTLWWLTRPVRFVPSLRVQFRQLRYGVKNWLQNVIALVNYRGYLIGVGTFFGPAAAAYFSVAMLVIEATRFVPETVGTMLLPKLVSTLGRQESAAFAARTARNTFFLAVLTVAALLVATPFLIVLAFGRDYEPSIAAAEIMLIGSLGGFFYQILTRYFSSEAKQRYTIYSALASLISGGLLAVVLVPALGLSGAAIAFACGQLMAGGMALYFFSRITNTPIRHCLLLDRTDIAYLAGMLRGIVRRKRLR